MPTPTSAKTFHSPAAACAADYTAHFGTAAAALAAVDQPGHNDAFEREVVQKLYALASDEAVAARGDRSWAEVFLEQCAAEDARDASWQAERAARAGADLKMAA